MTWSERIIVTDMTSPMPSQGPLNVDRLIIDSSHVPMDQLNNDFKFFVANSGANYRNVNVQLMNDYPEGAVSIGLNERYVNRERIFDLEVQIHKHPDGYLEKCGEFERVVRSEEEFAFINGALLHLAEILKNPETRIGKLHLMLLPYTPSAQQTLNRDKLLRKLGKTFHQLNHQLQVESLTMSIDATQDDILSVLSHLKPQTLTKMQISGTRRQRKDLPIDRIIQTDQWKGLKDIWLPSDVILEPFSVWCHFPDAKLCLPDLKAEQFERMLQHYINTPTFEHAAFFCPKDTFNHPELTEFFSKFPKLNEDRLLNERRVDIPNSTDYLIIFHGIPGRIDIAKKSTFVRRL